MKIFVLGELNVDLIMTGNDVTPEWNREKLVDTFDAVLGSSSAITACGLAGLGLDVQFVSVVGDDHFGRFCTAKLERMGVGTTYVHVDSQQKTGVTLSLSTEKDRALLTYMGTIPSLRPEHIPEELFTQAAHVHSGSFFLQQGMQKHWYDLFTQCRKNGISTSFDTGWDPAENWQPEGIVKLLEETSLFIPSEDELTKIFAANNLEEALQKLPIFDGITAIKRGKKGAILIGGPSGRIEMPAYDITPIDTTGAGDSFNAGFIYSFLNHQNEPEMLEFASACGAIATQRIGGATSVPAVGDVYHFKNTHTLRVHAKKGDDSKP